MSQVRQPVLVVPHGGGPCFTVALPAPFHPEAWASTKAFLAETGAALDPRPRAILVVSGHWEEAVATVSVAEKHSLLYDYYGFPAEAYALDYPARGDAEVTARVRALLADAGIPSAATAARGLDHGVFVPFMEMFPEADIPIVQLSLRADLDPAFHLALGRALQPLRDEGVLIVGSGNSYHNLRRLMPSPESDLDSRRFGTWLDEAMTHALPNERAARLAAWHMAPSARASHPREEHLLPHHVVAGAAGDDVGVRIFHDAVAGKDSYAYRFG